MHFSAKPRSHELRCTYAAGAYGADCVCNCCLDGCPEGAGYSFVLAGLFFCFLASFLLGCWLIYEGLKGALPSVTHLPADAPVCVGNIHRA